ncbi:MAG: GAF domain-containing protein [Dehalococcoidia bacterium]
MVDQRERYDLSVGLPAKLYQVFDTMFDGVVVFGPDGRVVYTNPAAEVMLGTPAAELRGQRIDASWSFSQHDGAPLSPEELPAARVLANGEAVGSMELTLERPEGARLTLLCGASPIKDDSGAVTGALASFADISERKESEVQLRESEGRFRHLLEANPVAFMLADREGRILEGNEGLVQLLGYSREELSSGRMSIRDITPPGYEELDRRSWEQLLSLGRREPFEKEYLAKDGSRVPVLVGGAMINDREAATYVVDLTQQKLGESRLRFVAEIGEILSSSLEYGETVNDFARLVVPTFADYCLIAEVRDDGTVRTAKAHADPARQHLLDALTAQPLRDEQSLAVRALRTGEPQLALDVTDSMLEAAATNAEQRRALLALGARSSIFVPLKARGRTLGVIGFAYAESGRRYSPNDLNFAIEISRRAALAIDNARLYDQTRIAELEARNSARRQEVLSEASRAFVNAGLDLRGVLDTVTRRVAELVGDVCIVGLLTEDGSLLETVSVAHVDPERLAVLRDLQAGPRPASEGLSGAVLESGEPMLVNEVDPADAAGRYQPYVERFGSSTAIVVPVRTASATLGILFLSRDKEGEPYTQDDLSFAVELASRTAQAIDTARLYQAGQEARRAAERAAGRTLRLQQVAAALADPLDRTAVALVAVDQAIAALGATAGSVVLLAPGRQDLDAVVARGYDDEVMRPWARFPLSAPVPLAECVRTGIPVWIESREQLAERYPELAPVPVNEALASIPLIFEGQVLGSVGLSFATRRSFSEDDKLLMAALGHQCAQALERARLLEESERAAYRVRSLAEASRDFAEGALSVTTLAETVARRLAELVGDGCVVRLFSEDPPTYRQIAAYHHDDGVREGLSAFNGQLRPANEGLSRGLTEQAGPIVVATVEEDHFTYIAQPYRDFFRGAGLGSLMLAPLSSRGRMIGMVAAFRMDPGRPYNDSELAFLVELADRAALALDNALLYDETRLAEEASSSYAERLQALATAALNINSTLSLEDVVSLITDRAREIVGAHQAVTCVAIETGQTEAACAASMSEKYVAWRDWTPAQELDGLAAVVCAENRPLRLTDEELLGYPSRVSDAAAAGPPLRGWLAAPLLQRDGRNMGLIQLSDKYRGDFSDQDEAVLVQLAQMASAAIENARLFAQAERALATRNRFLSMASHELKTPITSVKGYSQVLLRKAQREGDESSLEILSVIDSETDRMTRLINELLDVSRIERGRLDFEVKPMDLGEVLRESLGQLRIIGGGFSFNLHEPGEELEVRGDRMRIEQVFTNLVTNAMRYSQERREVEISARREGASAVVEVKDYGVGIPADQRSSVFELFFRGSNLAADHRGGMGLGLYICKVIVEEHGGRIEVDSVEGEGSTFRVILPLTQPRPRA